MRLFRVNEVLDSIRELEGQTLCVEGLLDSASERGVGLSHWPKAEQQSPTGCFSAGIDIVPDGPAFDFDEDVITKWSGKRVVVLGTLQMNPLIDSTMDWMGFPPAVALIKARRLDLLKRWNREHAAE